MRIGIVSPVDISAFIPFVDSKQDKLLLQQNCSPNSAPAVNTLILSFLDLGHYVRIFTLAPQSFIVKGNGVDIYTVSSYQKYPWKYLWGEYCNAGRLKKRLSTTVGDLDVLHAHWTYCYAYAAKYQSQQLPVFCTIRDWTPYIWRIESWKNKVTWSFLYFMNKSVLKDPNIHFIANSSYLASLIQKTYNKHIPVIPNSVKSSFVKKGEHIIPKKLSLLCISSSNDKRKNIEVLLEAFNMISQCNSDVSLSIIGAPFVSGEKKVERWRKKGLLQQVFLLGSVKHDDLISYIDKSSIYISPSLEETFGNTFIESMARKVPVIGGRNSGAIPSVLQNGNAGFLCDVTNSKSIKDMIEYVHTHPKIADICAEKAYEMIVNEYNDTIVGNRYIDLYSKFTK